MVPEYRDSAYLVAVASVDFDHREPTTGEIYPYRESWNEVVRYCPDEELIATACREIYRAKEYYPDLTMLYALQALGKNFSQYPGARVDDLAADLCLSLEDSYLAPIIEAEEMRLAEEQAIREQFEANQAAARERGAMRNQAQVERKVQAAEQQAQWQQQVREKAHFDRIRNPYIPPRRTPRYVVTSPQVGRPTVRGNGGSEDVYVGRPPASQQGPRGAPQRISR